MRGFAEEGPATPPACYQEIDQPDMTPHGTWKVGCVIRCQIDPDSLVNADFSPFRVNSMSPLFTNAIKKTATTNIVLLLRMLNMSKFLLPAMMGTHR